MNDIINLIDNAGYRLCQLPNLTTGKELHFRISPQPEPQDISKWLDIPGLADRFDFDIDLTNAFADSTGIIKVATEEEIMRYEFLPTD
jgi:hypothetical protein